MIYTVTMNPAIDYVVRLNNTLEIGTINRSCGEDIQFGGKGINVSNMLRELGQETVALGFVAGETGAWLERGLTQMGLQTRFVRLAQGQTRINVKVKGNEETEINGMGPVIGPEELERFYGILEAVGPGDALVLSGSVPSCLGKDCYARILARLEGRGILTVVDASGELLKKALRYQPFLIKPNDRELEEIAGRPLKTESELIAAAKMLQEMGARNVLISRAGDGALLLDENGGILRCKAPRGTVVNSVGAGDSMVAGFLTGWLKTGDYAQALKWGIAAGSATAFSLGLADRQTVERMQEKMI